jgi:hypothetical protein
MYLLIDGHRPRPKPERLRKGGGLGPFERQDKSPHDYSKQLARRALADVERGWYAGRGLLDPLDDFSDLDAVDRDGVATPTRAGDGTGPSTPNAEIAQNHPFGQRGQAER